MVVEPAVCSRWRSARAATSVVKSPFPDIPIPDLPPHEFEYTGTCSTASLSNVRQTASDQTRSAGASTVVCLINLLQICCRLEGPHRPVHPDRPAPRADPNLRPAGGRRRVLRGRVGRPLWPERNAREPAAQPARLRDRFLQRLARGRRHHLRCRPGTTTMQVTPRAGMPPAASHDSEPNG
jgi:hypothetical protein